MLLAIDIGNTNITLGIFADAYPRTKLSRHAPPLRASGRLVTSVPASSYYYAGRIKNFLKSAGMEPGLISSVAIASVVPSLDPVFEMSSRKLFKLKPFFINEKSKIPLENLYQRPKDVGADRIVNAVAGYLRFGAPCVVVDFGTATTFDCVTRKAEYAGGIIVPGPVLASESLHLRTAKLPKVDIARPRRLIGKNTAGSIQSGLYYGYASLIDGILDRLKKELGPGTRVLATGGLASLMAGVSRWVGKSPILPNLTLEGIYLVWERNCS